VICLVETTTAAKLIPLVDRPVHLGWVLRLTLLAPGLVEAIRDERLRRGGGDGLVETVSGVLEAAETTVHPSCSVRIIPRGEPVTALSF
jgi:hypothetical protein